MNELAVVRHRNERICRRSTRCSNDKATVPHVVVIRLGYVLKVPRLILNVFSCSKWSRAYYKTRRRQHKQVAIVSLTCIPSTGSHSLKMLMPFFRLLRMPELRWQTTSSIVVCRMQPAPEGSTAVNDPVAR